MTIEQILLLVVTLAVVVMTVFIVVLICKLCKTLNLFQKKLEELGDEPKDLLMNVNGISADLNCKLKCFDPLFRAIGNVGEGLEYTSTSFKEKFFWKTVKDKLEPEEEACEDKVSDIVDMAVSGINLWKKLKK